MTSFEKSVRQITYPDMTETQSEQTETPQLAIYRVVRAIPRGKVLSYGAVAKMAGLGKAARFVGSTLRKLPRDSTLPWHRVINSQGRIALPEHHPGRQLQEQKLNDEGVVFTKGRVNLNNYLWKP